MLRDRLTMVVLCVSTLGALGGVLGWIGLKDVIINSRPVWFSELIEARDAIDERFAKNETAALRDKVWMLRRDKRLTEEAIFGIRSEIEDKGSTPDRVERQVKLTSQLEWIDKGLKTAEEELQRR